MRDRMNVYFPPEMLRQIADLADRKKLSRSAIVEAAVASFLSPDGADKREAAFARWGLLGPWMKEANDPGRQINARSETVATSPAFRPHPARPS